MSDTLRDQLLKAGFKSKTPDKALGKSLGKSSKNASTRKKSAKKAHGSRTGNSHPSTESLAELNKVTAAQALEKKKLKETIKTLIEANTVKDYAGSASFGFVVGTRVRQLFVKEEYRNQLSEGTLVITRLNGNTHLVTPGIAKKILALNPQWAVFSNADNSSTSAEDSDEYADYQVPDDLTW